MIAVVLTLVAAFFFGLSSVMEQRSTKQVPQRGALSPRLLVDLARRALWLTAIGVNLVGSVLQVVALHFGALAVVQPIVASDVLFAVLISLLAWRRRPTGSCSRASSAAPPGSSASSRWLIPAAAARP